MNDADAVRLISETTLVSRSSDVLATAVGEEVLMMAVDTGRYFGLDDIASDIWNRLERPCRFADLIDGLAADYAADRATIAQDVRKLLLEMAAQRILQLD